MHRAYDRASDAGYALPVPAATGSPQSIDRDSPYCAAFLDWIACATAGASERAASSIRASAQDLSSQVAFAGAAGHVLDYDDTFSDGVAHVSAACAPAALVLGADLGRTLADVLEAYAAGFESMAALAAASHPALYERGWHPTAVCGPVGAAVAAAHLLGLGVAQRENAVRVALLRSGGTRGAFGSDGKAIQVALAAAAGVQAALLAQHGATVTERAVRGAIGFEGVFGARFPDADPESPAIERNWIKLHPSCLGTHSPIEAAAAIRSGDVWPGEATLRVLVHPTARRAAHLDLAADGLEAKFSIPYCVAHTILRGSPGVRDFAGLDPEVRELSRRVEVDVDNSLPEFGAVLLSSGRELARVPAPAGSPERPVNAAELAQKILELAGDRLDGLLDDLGAPATSALAAARLDF
jgi:2-methylcitrate dehydratase PrpD